MTPYEQYVAAIERSRKQTITKEFEKIARRTAREWGSINSQRKIKTRLGHVWYYDCAGHGGYIAVMGHGTAPKWMTKCKHNTWNWLGADIIDVFVFEEDCDWAVLEYFDVDALTYSYKRWRENAQRVLTLEEFRQAFVVPVLKRYNPWVFEWDESRDWCPTCNGLGWTWDKDCPPCTDCNAIGLAAVVAA